jgi:hypothetical protein
LGLSSERGEATEEGEVGSSLFPRPLHGEGEGTGSVLVFEYGNRIDLDQGVERNSSLDTFQIPVDSAEETSGGDMMVIARES